MEGTKGPPTLTFPQLPPAPPILRQGAFGLLCKLYERFYSFLVIYLTFSRILLIL